MTASGTTPARDGDTAGTLTASGIDRAFEGLQVLRSVSLTLHRHEILGLLGPNGAGKTTLVNILTGFDRPDRGRVELEGQDITRWKPHRRGRSGLARTFQHGHLFADLSVQENIEVGALGVGVGPAEARRRARELMAQLDLADLRGATARALPHGLERKLGVARALATSPRYLLLDEPAAGLNEAEVPGLVGVLDRVREQRTGILLIEHNIALILDVCDRILVLDEGAVIAEGDAAHIRSHPEVARAYLGLSTESAAREG